MLSGESVLIPEDDYIHIHPEDSVPLCPSAPNLAWE